MLGTKKSPENIFLSTLKNGRCSKQKEREKKCNNGPRIEYLKVVKTDANWICMVSSALTLALMREQCHHSIVTLKKSTSTRRKIAVPNRSGHFIVTALKQTGTEKHFTVFKGLLKRSAKTYDTVFKHAGP